MNPRNALKPLLPKPSDLKADMKITVKDSKGNDQGELEVSFPLIENKKGTQAVHDVVVAYQAAQRSGTACTKNVGEVAGTNKKPWRQKGTGRARAGSFRSPLWRGGGVVFGPKPRDFRKKVSKRTRQLALRKSLSERLKAGDVVIVDDLKLESHKTKLCPLHKKLDDALAQIEEAFTSTTIADILAEPTTSKPLCPFPYTDEELVAGRISLK